MTAESVEQTEHTDPAQGGEIVLVEFKRYGFTTSWGVSVNIGIEKIVMTDQKQSTVAVVVGDRSSVVRDREEGVALAGALGSVSLLREARAHISKVKLNVVPKLQ